MKRIHSCKITTLKNQDWWKNNKDRRGTHIFCQHLSNLQVADEGGYYHEVANEGCRGAVCGGNVHANIFDIAVNPRCGNLGKRVKEGFLAILREKVANDLVAYRKMLDDMKAKGAISDSDGAGIEMHDVASKMIEVGGVCVGGFEKMNEEERLRAIQKAMYVVDRKKKRIRSAVKKIAAMC